MIDSAIKIQVENYVLRPFPKKEYEASGFPNFINIFNDLAFANTPRGDSLAAQPNNDQLLVFKHDITSDNYLHLAEIRFFDQNGEPVVVSASDILPSSSSNSYPVSRLVDGDTKNFWHTTAGEGIDVSKQENWIRINLTAYPTVRRVIVYNRADCCQTRFDNTMVSYLSGAANSTLRVNTGNDRSQYEFKLDPKTQTVVIVPFDRYEGKLVRNMLTGEVFKVRFD